MASAILRLRDSIIKFKSLYLELLNKNISFHFIKGFLLLNFLTINDKINHLKRRVTLAQEESKSGKGDKYLPQYISELNEEIKKLDQQQQQIVCTKETKFHINEL
jgi:hypothetical protein